MAHAASDAEKSERVQLSLRLPVEVERAIRLKRFKSRRFIANTYIVEAIVERLVRDGDLAAPLSAS